MEFCHCGKVGTLNVVFGVQFTLLREITQGGATTPAVLDIVAREDGREDEIKYFCKYVQVSPPVVKTVFLNVTLSFPTHFDFGN